MIEAIFMISLLIADFFAIWNIGGAKELVVLLWLSDYVWNKQWTKRVGLSFKPHFGGFGLNMCLILYLSKFDKNSRA